MSQLRIAVSHQLTLAQAKQRIMNLADQLRKKHSDHISDVRMNWRGEGCTCELTLKGFRVVALIQVRDREVVVSGDVPFPANLLQSKIEAVLRRNLQELLARPEAVAPDPVVADHHVPQASVSNKQAAPTGSRSAQSPPRQPRPQLPAGVTIDMPATVSDKTPIVFTINVPIGAISVLDLELSMKMCAGGRRVGASRNSTATHEITVYRIGPLTNPSAWFAKGDAVLLRHLGVIQATILAQSSRS